MMLTNFKQTSFQLIKVISTILIVGAIALELGNLYLWQMGLSWPSYLQIPLWFGHFALSAHLIEGAIAAVYAPTKCKNPFNYGFYTFFVGTVGLFELFE